MWTYLGIPASDFIITSNVIWQQAHARQASKHFMCITPFTLKKKVRPRGIVTPRRKLRLRDLRDVWKIKQNEGLES